MQAQVVKEDLLSTELLRRTLLIQGLGPGPASLLSSCWMATTAFFLRPGNGGRGKETDGQKTRSKRGNGKETGKTIEYGNRREK